MIAVESLPHGTQVTISNDEVSPARLNRWLEWLRLEAAAHRCQLSEADADRLADELKDDWWAVNKARFISAAPL